MARVAVEQRAMTDPRFAVLGRAIGGNRWEAIGRCLLVWNQCQESNQYALSPSIINALHDDLTMDFAAAIVACGLGRVEGDGRVYVCGTPGRIEWLETQRRNGAKGGRPRKGKTQPKTDGKPMGYSGNNPPASASASASKTKTLRVPRRDCDDAFARCLKLVPILKGERGARKQFDSDIKRLEHDAVDAEGLASAFAAFVHDLETGIVHYAEECRREKTERRFVKQAASLFADFREYIAEPAPARLQLVVPLGGTS